MVTLNLEHIFKGHSDKCWSVSIHKDLPLLASVSSDKTCRLYNLNTRQLIAVLDDNAHTKTLRSVAWKPTGDFPSLAIGSFDSTVSIWGKDDIIDDDDGRDDEEYDQNEIEVDVNGSGKPNMSSALQAGGEWVLMAIIEGHENEIKCVNWSGDGHYLATCSRDKSTWIWETDETNEEFECINVIQEHTQDVKHVVWHPQEKMLASSSYDDTTKLFKQDPYDEDDWLCVSNLTEHKGTVWCSDFEKPDVSNPNKEARLVTCSDDSTVNVYKRIGSSGLTNTDKDEIPSTLRPEPATEEWILESQLPLVHKGSIYSINWGSNGLIASVGEDGKLVIYKENITEKKWEVLITYETAHGICEINCVQWWNNDYLVTAGDDGNVNLWKFTL